MSLSRLIDLVSVSSSGQSSDFSSGDYVLSINRDGSLIGFFSQANTLFSPNPAGGDYVIKNLNDGSFQVLTLAFDGELASGGGASNAYNELAISADGRFQAFGSTSLLTSSSDSTGEDIFIRSPGTNKLVMASDAQGGVKSYHASMPDISDNGNFVVFQSMDNLLAATDRNGAGDTDVYWFNKGSGELRMVSGAFGGNPQGSNGGNEADSAVASVSNDGQYVVFQSTAADLVNGDTNNYADILLRDMVHDQIYLLTSSPTGQGANSSSSDAVMTPDAHYVVYSSSASNLTNSPASGHNIFRFNVATGETQVVNTTADGVVVSGAFQPQISADGRYVVFESNATDLVPIAGDSNAVSKIFVKDLQTGNVAIASLKDNAGVNSGSAYAPQISDDGQFIAFTSNDALVARDSNDFIDVYRVTNPVYGSGSDLANDVFTDSPENETFDGGSGLDMVVYSHNRADHVLTKTAAGYGLAGDNLVNIERIQFWDKSVALDATATGNAGQAMEFIGVIAPSLLGELSVRGSIISLFDQEYTMAQLCQVALDLNLVAHGSHAELANAVFRNVTGGAASQEMTNALVDYIGSNGQANFLSAVAGLALNIDLVGLQQTGIEFI